MESEQLAFATAVKKACGELRIEGNSCGSSVDDIANNLVLDFVAALPLHKGKRNLLHGT